MEPSRRSITYAFHRPPLVDALQHECSLINRSINPVGLRHIRFVRLHRFDQFPSPDGAFVTFWVRKQNGSGGDINIWAVPTLGGSPKPYLEGVAEYDWSHDGSRLAYHTPGPGDPLFVSDGSRRSEGRHIFTAPASLHCHGQPLRQLS